MSKARAPVQTDKDFGRRLYASDKGYAEQMKEVTDKAKLDVAPFHLSEFKKPYLTDNYVEMEHQYSPVGGIPPVHPLLPDNPESDTTEGRMRWKVEPPDEGEPEHWYLVEVWNRVKEQATTQSGKVTKYKRTYYPAWFEMKNTETGTKGFKLEISLPSAVLDATGEIRGFYAGNNVWYDVKTKQGTIKAILAYLQQKGTTQAFTTGRLTIEAEAKGESEIKAKDGKTELRHKVRASDEELPPEPVPVYGYWLRLTNAEGVPTGYYLPIDSTFQATGEPVHGTLITFEHRDDRTVEGFTAWNTWTPADNEYAGETTVARLTIEGVIWKTGGASFHQILRPGPIRNTFVGVFYMDSSAICDYISVPEDGIIMWTEGIGRGETTDPPVNPSYYSSKLSKFGVVSTLYEGDGPLINSPLENKLAQRGQSSYFASNGSWYYSYVVIDWNENGAQPELKLFIIDENGVESSNISFALTTSAYVFEVLPGYHTVIPYAAYIGNDSFAIRRGINTTESFYFKVGGEWYNVANPAATESREIRQTKPWSTSLLTSTGAYSETRNEYNSVTSSHQVSTIKSQSGATVSERSLDTLSSFFIPDHPYHYADSSQEGGRFLGLQGVGIFIGESINYRFHVDYWNQLSAISLYSRVMDVAYAEYDGVGVVEFPADGSVITDYATEPDQYTVSGQWLENIYFVDIDNYIIYYSLYPEGTFGNFPEPSSYRITGKLHGQSFSFTSATKPTEVVYGRPTS